jgi:hypothetical protein
VDVSTYAATILLTDGTRTCGPRVSESLVGDVSMALLTVAVVLVATPTVTSGHEWWHLLVLAVMAARTWHETH